MHKRTRVCDNVLLKCLWRHTRFYAAFCKESVDTDKLRLKIYSVTRSNLHLTGTRMKTVEKYINILRNSRFLKSQASNILAQFITKKHSENIQRR